METRITKAQMFMQIANVVKNRSTCLRSKVGCIITNEQGTVIVSMGYNGNAKGLPNFCDGTEPGKCGCIHAEINALLKAPYDMNAPLHLYTTMSPCLSCSKLILNSAVSHIFIQDLYRTTEGLRILIQSGVKCIMQQPDHASQSTIWIDGTTLKLGRVEIAS